MRICKFAGARTIGKPKDWDDALDGDCLEIFVSDHVDTLTGLPTMFTIYQLSDEEIDALKNGGLLRLGICGTVHPVFTLSVLDDKLAELIEPQPVGDMGPVIRG